MRDERSLLDAVLGDGRFLIALAAISLALSGRFALLQSVSGQLLPHDSMRSNSQTIERMALRRLYSSRNTTIGSTPAARRAGKYAADTATVANSKTTNAKVHGSVVLTP